MKVERCCGALPEVDNNKNTQMLVTAMLGMCGGDACACACDCAKGISGLVDHTFILFRSAAGNDRLSWRKPIIDTDQQHQYNVISVSCMWKAECVRVRAFACVCVRVRVIIM